MLYLLVAFTVISFICLWAGWLFFGMIPVRSGAAEDGPAVAGYTRPLIVYLLTGLMLLTGIGQWLVLFRPLDTASLLAVLLLLGLITIAGRRQLSSLFILSKRPAIPIIIACLALFFMILVLNAGPAIMDDTDSYHIQMIKWAQEYGTVPGIANLHLRFGFNSSWFTAIALLCPRIKGVDHYLVLNGLLSCWFCYYLLEKIMRPSGPGLTQGTGFSVLAFTFLLAAGLLIWPLVRGNAASANYDFVATFSILVLLAESMETSRPQLWMEWMIWPCFLFTIRIINAPLLLISIIAAVFFVRRYRRIPWMPVLLAAFFVLPFLARNYILSGYPLFPLYQFAPFAPDWKADRHELIQITEFVKYFNRSAGNPESVRGLGFPGWLSIWFRDLYPYNKVLLTLSFLSWLGIGLRWKKWVHSDTAVVKGLIGTLALSLLCWFLTAPDPRFNYGALLAGPFLFLLLYPSRRVVIPSLPAAATTVILTLFLFYYSARKWQNDPGYRNPLTPHALPVPEYRVVKVDGIDLRIPEKILDNWNPRCYGLPLPCLYRINPRLHSRGKDIRDGFRLEGPLRGRDPRRPVGPDNPEEDEGEYKID